MTVAAANTATPQVESELFETEGLSVEQLALVGGGQATVNTI